jgi:hypothetical protein
MLPVMKLTELLPEIPEAEQTPLVKQLVAVIEQLAERVGQLAELTAQLKDESAMRKGHAPRPKIQPSRLEEPPVCPSGGPGAPPEPKAKRPRRPGKTAARVIHPELVPAGSRFLGYADYVVQDLRIERRFTRFRLARWRPPEGGYLKGQLPEAAPDQHFGAHLRSYMRYQYYQKPGHPAVGSRQQWHACGLDISSGQLARRLSRKAMRPCMPRRMPGCGWGAGGLQRSQCGRHRGPPSGQEWLVPRRGQPVLRLVSQPLSPRTG